jgi:hypothetical protein
VEVLDSGMDGPGILTLSPEPGPGPEPGPDPPVTPFAAAAAAAHEVGNVVAPEGSWARWRGVIDPLPGAEAVLRCIAEMGRNAGEELGERDMGEWEWEGVCNIGEDVIAAAAATATPKR